MKCVKNLSTNEIKRVSDDRAVELVSMGKWNFAPKKEWKAQRPAPVTEVKASVEEPTEQKKSKVPAKKAAWREEKRRKRQS